MNYCFGVDIGGTTIKMGLFQFDGLLVEKWEIKTNTANGGCAILPDIAASINIQMGKYHLTQEQILGIGVGVPAPVSETGVVQKTANLGWGYKEVAHELKELTGIHVVVGNDANVAALGEMWKGGGLGHKNMIMITLGTGVGGGVIVGGKIMSGSTGAGGEIGHLCVNEEETESCGCGKKGCLEQYASATGIVRLAKKKLENETRKTLIPADDISAKTVFDAVKEGDEVAIEIAEEFGTYLGHAIANLAVIVDPAVVVIGGGVSKAGEVLLKYIDKHFRERVFFANEHLQFSLAKLGNDAGICGAAKMILD